ncbi:hypothetical protein, partial [Clostridium sp.]|uniref:hypothetical protein n=1 Tax=Clostridium sp. TaxID=1506 RepID=UPI003F36E454
VLLFSNFYTIKKVGNLEGELESIRFSISNLSIGGEVRTIINESLQEQNKIVEAIDLTYGELLPDSLSVELRLKVTPKEYSEGSNASLLLNEKEIPMVYENSAFTLNTEVSILDDIKGIFKLNDNGVIKTSEIKEFQYENLRDRYLLNPNAYFSGEWNLTSLGTFYRKGTIELDSYTSEKNSIQKATFINEVNREKISEEELEGNSDKMKLNIESKISVRDGDIVDSYIVIEDTYGLQYIYGIDNFKVGMVGIDEKFGRIVEGYGLREIKTKDGTSIWNLKLAVEG